MRFQRRRGAASLCLDGRLRQVFRQVARSMVGNESGTEARRFFITRAAMTLVKGQI